MKVTDIRWMIRRDMPDILAIENAVFEYPWDDQDFVKTLRQRNFIGQVAEHDGRVVGYFVYGLNRTFIEVVNFAVHPDCQRQGVGSAMIAKLRSKLSEQRRSRFVLDVRESNLDAQLFFRAMGMRATGLIRGRFEDHGARDAYHFVYRLKCRELAADPLK